MEIDQIDDYIQSKLDDSAIDVDIQETEAPDNDKITIKITPKVGSFTSLSKYLLDKAPEDFNEKAINEQLATALQQIGELYFEACWRCGFGTKKDILEGVLGQMKAEAYSELPHDAANGFRKYVDKFYKQVEDDE